MDVTIATVMLSIIAASFTSVVLWALAAEGGWSAARRAAVVALVALFVTPTVYWLVGAGILPLFRMAAAIAGGVALAVGLDIWLYGPVRES